MQVAGIHVLPDDRKMIADFLKEACDNAYADIILTSGARLCAH